MIRKKRQNDIIKDKLSLIPYLSLKKNGILTFLGRIVALAY